MHNKSDLDSRVSIPSTSVSARHLKVHSILYEDEDGRQLPPLVYVQDTSSNGTLIKKYGEQEVRRLVRSDEPVLLNDGDLLLLGEHTICLFHILPNDGKGPQLNETQAIEARTFDDIYKITDQVLGFGSQGSVFVAVHFRTRRQLACKVLPIKPPLNTDGLVDLHPEKALELLKQLSGYRELDILKDLNHVSLIEGVHPLMFGAKYHWT
jgi:FHA domain